MPEIDTGDTAWVLASTALVMIMTPGVAFFYGGLARVKSVVNVIMMSLACLAVVSVLWVLVGFTVAFGPDTGAGVIGNLDKLGLDGTIDTATGTVPTLAFVAFQLMFAIITPALISGAIADRQGSAGGCCSWPSGACSSTHRSPTGCSSSTAGAAAGSAIGWARSTSPAAPLFT